MNAVHELNRALALALGLPKHTTKAVLTLQVGKIPTLQIECFMPGEDSSATCGDTGRLSSVQFMVRLEPFSTRKDTL